MLSHGYRRQIGVALLIVLAAAMVVTPATASSQLDGDDCEPQRALIVRSLDAPALAAIAEFQVEVGAARLAMRNAEVRAARAFDGHRTELTELREQLIVSMPDIAELDLAIHVDALEVLDRIEVLAIVDRGVEIPDLESWQHRWVVHETASDAAQQASHPLTAGIDLLVDLARLPGQAAMVTQHLLEAFAKVIPRVLRSLL